MTAHEVQVESALVFTLLWFCPPTFSWRTSLTSVLPLNTTLPQVGRPGTPIRTRLLEAQPRVSTRARGPIRKRVG